MERTATDITILDQPKKPIITQELLDAARARRDITIFEYPKVTTSFTEDASEQVSVDSLKVPEKICESVLDLVGRTPMIRLSRFAKKYNIACDLVAKCEMFSAGGSVKDRIGVRMVEEAEQKKLIQPGDTLIEPTSGNTGIGMSLAAALKGYNMVITLPEKMSQEKADTMIALGAEVVRTPTEASWNSLDSHMGLAAQLAATLPNAHVLDQYKNPGNPRAHYLGTAEEILYQCDNKIDMIVLGAGTGGTVSGIAAKIKERLPNCRIVGVDPHGSILAEPPELNCGAVGRTYLVEGIGYDYIPSTLNRKLVDEWVKITDEESFRLAREIIRTEGLLIGGSSGAAIAGALKAAKSLKPDQRCVVLFPDSCRNYMTKFVSDDWMRYNDFYPPPEIETPFGNRTVEDLGTLKRPATLTSSAQCSEAVKMMEDHGVQQLPVVDTDGSLLGVVQLSAIAKAVVTGRGKMTDPVLRHVVRRFKAVEPSCRLAEVVQALNVVPYCMVMANGKLEGVLTLMDVMRVL